ncbi:MAG: hypothetical protein JOZ72_14040 [Alphaproteobacteria bacterium]|nr:hypothetical protein [Alphaproteobacteria bacterium]
MLMRSAAFAVIGLSFLPAAASAGTLSVLKTFCESTGCRDGNTPFAPLIRDPGGNLFGTTDTGGAHNRGTVFELLKTRSGYTFRRIYDFCSKSDCADGYHPRAGLIMDASGNLYGTATNGGVFGTGYRGGVAFKLTPGSQQWTLTKLHDFCAKADCVDGKTPMAGLTYQGASSGALYDGSSPLFGTTIAGGTADQGVAYKLTFIPGRAKPQETALYSFCSQTDCADGLQPAAPLAIDAAGNIYGTTGYGGANGASDNGGVVFQLTPKRKGYAYTVLHSFCTLANCADGNRPSRSGVTIDGDGNLLGSAGGPYGGIIFKVVPSGASSTFSTLYTFCTDTVCDDGASPDFPLLVDASGDVFGTTTGGGPQNAGTIFKLHDGAESVLYSFCQNCNDGAYPFGVAMDGSGTIFGVTFTTRNTGQGGTVYELAP